MKLLLSLLMLVSLAAVASADGLVYHLYGGAQGMWLDASAPAFPVDLEASGSAAASLTPHLSAVGDVDYGFSHSYLRGSGGLRATFSDASDPNFNTFVGVRYRGASISAFGPNEWAPDAGFGWRPAPASWPHFIFVGDAGYGLTSKTMLLTLGGKWEVGPSK